LETDRGKKGAIPQGNPGSHLPVGKETPGATIKGVAGFSKALLLKFCAGKKSEGAPVLGTGT